MYLLAKKKNWKYWLCRILVLCSKTAPEIRELAKTHSCDLHDLKSSNPKHTAIPNQIWL